MGYKFVTNIYENGTAEGVNNVGTFDDGNWSIDLNKNSIDLKLIFYEQGDFNSRRYKIDSRNYQYVLDSNFLSEVQLGDEITILTYDNSVYGYDIIYRLESNGVEYLSLQDSNEGLLYSSESTVRSAKIVSLLSGIILVISFFF